MADPFALERFTAAQDSNGMYERAVAELRAGRKSSHWIWYIFPQIAGLGHSLMSQRFAISSLAEARAYLRHPVLGPRLRQCTETVLSVNGKTAEEILGTLDAVKLRSSMTLFSSAAPDEPVFQAVLDKYFGGAADQSTISRL